MKKIKKILSPRSNQKDNVKHWGADFSDPVSTDREKRYVSQRNQVAAIKNILKRNKNKSQNSRSHYSQTETKKKSQFKNLGVLFCSLCVISLFIYVFRVQVIGAIESVGFFHVRSIKIDGCNIVSPDMVKKSSGIKLHHTSLLTLKGAEVKNELQSLAWVSKAEVERNWPSSVVISIQENIPVGIVNISSDKEEKLQYIDKTGTPFLEVQPGADIDYPVLTGFSKLSDADIKAKAYKQALGLLKRANTNNPYLPSQVISEINVNSGGHLTMYLVEYPFPIYFGKGYDKKSHKWLVTILKTLYKKKRGKSLISSVKYIQMDYLENKVLVARNPSN